MAFTWPLNLFEALSTPVSEFFDLTCSQRFEIQCVFGRVVIWKTIRPQKFGQHRV